MRRRRRWTHVEDAEVVDTEAVDPREEAEAADPREEEAEAADPREA